MSKTNKPHTAPEKKADAETTKPEAETKDSDGGTAEGGATTNPEENGEAGNAGTTPDAPGDTASPAPATATTKKAKAGTKLEGAPDAPEEFAFVGAITVSKSSAESGRYFIQFSNGKEAHSADNASHVGLLAQRFFQELLS